MNGWFQAKRALSTLVFSLAIMISAAGCNLFGLRPRTQTPPARPSPTRFTGRRTRTPLPTSPTKRLPGISATNAKAMEDSCTRIMAAIQKNDWTAATRETDRLGVLWTRFKPSKTGTMSATEMKNFDTRYAKLQKDVRARNKTGALSAARACRDTIVKMTR
ncbi:MAG: DUF4363 family protein [Firmicutes bacterium]|nr:DUF4363 family protein [Bacillota bacterium]